MILTSINKHWSWTGVDAVEIIASSEFGNVIFKSAEETYWRLCPEELYCSEVAENLSDLNALMVDPNFLQDWEMKEHLVVAKEKLGELQTGEKYCLKLPIPFGGEHSLENFDTILQIDQISYAGQLASKMDALPPGTKIEFDV